ncbi:MAG TPA: hypothetical protein VN709_13675 [Terriglobales bacterium]|nr:hypothetical protein [Terriglobales bacterium]
MARAATSIATMDFSEPEMGCIEFETALAEHLDREQLPAAAQAHLAECAACAAVLSDFESIADQVRQLTPLESETIPDLWPEIRDTLRREGIIHFNGQTPPPAPKLVRK